MVRSARSAGFVDRQPAVAGVAQQRRPAGQRVLDRAGQRVLCRQPAALGGEPITQHIEQRHRAVLSRYLIGWRGYFGFCETPSVLRGLDQRIRRRRLRALVCKQWKRGRTRFAALRRRGVVKDLAAQTAGRPHGPWRLEAIPDPDLTAALRKNRAGSAVQRLRREVASLRIGVATAVLPGLTMLPAVSIAN